MAQRPGMNIALSSIDDLFGGAAPETATGEEKIVNLPLDQIHDFPGHPYDIEYNSDFVDSIRMHGVLVPAIVRPRPEGGWYAIAGHCRRDGSKDAGKVDMPCIIRDVDDDTAIIMMVDSNNQRENIKPSVKAKALKMKLDAMKRQGKRTDLTCTQVGYKLENNKKSIDIVAEQAGESSSQVQRLIRLTELAPELLEKVDKSELALTPAVELSYLPPEEQKQVAELIEVEGRTPSLSQAQQIKKLSQEKKLDDETLGGIFIQQKPQERRTLTLKGERLEKFYTDKYTPAQFEDIVFKALADYFQRQRNKERKNEEMGAR